MIFISPGADELFGAWRRDEREIHPMTTDLRQQSAGQLVNLIDQLAAEVAAEENELRLNAGMTVPDERLFWVGSAVDLRTSGGAEPKPKAGTFMPAERKQDWHSLKS